MCNVCYDHQVYKATGKNGALTPIPCPKCGNGKKPVIYVAVVINKNGGKMYVV